MSIVQKLREEVQVNRKSVFKNKLMAPILANREEQREIEEYKVCMDMYADMQRNPFNYRLEHLIDAEDVLDRMIKTAVVDQKKHRQYAKEALEQETSGVKITKLWAK